MVSQIRGIGIPDEFVEQGSQAALRAKYGLDAGGIMQQVLDMLPKRDSVSSHPGSFEEIIK